MQGILLQIRYFEREFKKRFKKVNFRTAWHPYVTRMCLYDILVLVSHSYVTGMYSYVIRVSLVCGFTVNLLKSTLARHAYSLFYEQLSNSVESFLSSALCGFRKAHNTQH